MQAPNLLHYPLSPLSLTMPAILKPLLGLALLFGRLRAQTPYETLCSSPPSQPDELEPGVMATYQCDHAFYTDDWTGESSSADTPRACALQCARWSSEGRCGWQNNICYRYKAGKNSAMRFGGVAIQIQEFHDTDDPSINPEKTPEKECSSELNACSAEKSIIDNQLGACNTEKGTISKKLEQCDANSKMSTATLQAQLASCKAEQTALNGNISKCRADAAAKANDLQARLDQHLNCTYTSQKRKTPKVSHMINPKFSRRQDPWRPL